MEESFRIPKIHVPIRCYTLPGDEIAGDIFLDILLSEGYSPEQVLEFFNSEEAFFPLRVSADARTLLIRRDFVFKVEIPQLNRSFIDHFSSFALQKEATLYVQGLPAMRVTFILEMPEERTRISDLMNLKDRFFPVLMNENFTIINSDHVYKIEE